MIEQNEFELLKNIKIYTYSIEVEEVKKIITYILNNIKDKETAYIILLDLFEYESKTVKEILNDELSNKIYDIKEFIKEIN